MIPTLLHLIPLPKDALAKALLPLMTVPVEPELAPYLVSSLNSVVWVPRVSKEGDIRTAFRPHRQTHQGMVMGEEGWVQQTLETELIRAVFERSRREGWGSVHPLTPDGLKQAQEYLQSFGIEEVEYLKHPLTKLSVPAMSVKWMPLRMVVLVPKNRVYLGTMHVVSKDQVAAVVHNPSRGMAFCWESVTA